MTCNVCGGTTRTVIELPGFIGGDQSLRQCSSCGHGQLAVEHQQTCGYVSAGTDYSRAGVDWFASHLKGEYRCVLDFGCNDGHLLRKINSRRRIGVDLSMPALEFETHTTLNTVDAEPDLIVSRHTLEHLPDPLGTLKTWVAMASPDATFAIEVPCLDSLIESLRFDQVYNDHLQYFTFMSLQSMLLAAGLQEFPPLHFNRNPHSVMAICKKGQAFKMTSKPTQAIAPAYAAFHTYTLAVGDAFMCAPKRIAYGASAVLPVLLYHLGLTPADFHAIVDDRHDKNIDLKDATVLITAPDSFREIYAKCGQAKAVMSAVPMI